jgi:AraC-like DNA-binding protein
MQNNYRREKIAQASREELIERLHTACLKDGGTEMAQGLQFYRYSHPTQPTHGVYLPSLVLIAQGAKEVRYGDEKLRYDPYNYLLVSLDVPTVSQVLEATPEAPHLALRLELDPPTISSVMVETGVAPGRNDMSVKSMAVSSLTHELLDAFLRLIRLLDIKDDYRVVSHLVIREIIYRILKSEQGPRLRQMAAFGGHTNRIAKAVQMLRSRFAESLSIEQIASELGMSVSSFHQHFKTATSMSPLQFQKMLRLQEARNLLLSEDLDASYVAVRVGYDDPSQFTREYKRLFGAPPKRDVSRVKQLVTSGTDI